MNWRAWRVTFQLQSPMHIGRMTQGNVQYTRLYVPGKTLWGALTSRLTRDLAGGSEQHPLNYQTTGHWVNNNLAFSYFYFIESKEVSISWPWMDQRQFEWLYLNSYTSTALADGHSKEDSSLHETEFISATTRTGDGVRLSGFIFSDSGAGEQWKDSLSRLQIGGERSYGWGKVRLLQIKAAQDSELNQSFGGAVSLTSARPAFRTRVSEPMRAHVDALSLDGATKIDGSLEPLVGRETNPALSGANPSFGTQLSSPTFAWAPGASCPSELDLEVGSFGIWRGRKV